MNITTTILGNATVRLEATDNSGTVTWYRTVRGQDQQLGTGLVHVDHLVPLNIGVVYYAQDQAGTEVAPELEVVSGEPHLTSTMHGDTHPVVVVSQPPMQWEARSVAHRILNDPEPRVAIAPASFPTGTMRLHLPDRSTFHRGDQDL